MGDISSDEAWSPTRILTEVFGADRDSADELSRDQAIESFSTVLSGDPAPAAVGAYLLANQWKPNTSGELGAFLDAMIAESIEESKPIFDAIDCTPPFRGVEHTALLGPAANTVAAAAGAPIVMGGWGEVGSYGRYVNTMVLEELDVKRDLTLDQCSSMVDETQFGFYPVTVYNPSVHDLRDIRTDVGLQTPLDIVERLGNPSDADTYVGSRPDQPVPDGLGEVCVGSESCDFDTVYQYDGLEGYDVFDPKSSTIEVYAEGEYTDVSVDLEELGVAYDGDDLVLDDVPTTSADVTTEIIHGQREDALSNAATLNAAVRIFAAEAASSIAEGVEMARKAIADGEAEDTLDSLKTFRSTGTMSLDW